MEKFLKSLLIIICAIQIGCSGTSQNENVLDYSTLPDLEVDIIVEIEESEDFLPGRLRDLILAQDGSIIISDWGNMNIVHFDSDGSFKSVIAERGQGPGELKSPFSLIDSKRDTLLVNYRGMTYQTDVYIRDEIGNTFFYEHSLTSEIENNRLIFIEESAPGFGYFARFEDLNHSRTRERFDPPAYRSETIGIVGMSGEVLIDSLHLLQTPNTVFIEREGGAITPLGAPPFLSRDHLKSLGDDKYIIAKSGEGKIQVYDQNHDIQNEIILDVKERSVTKNDLDHQLRNIPEQFQGELRERASSIKPDFTDVWVSNEYFLLQTDEGEKGIEMVLLTEEGEPIGKFTLSHYDEIQVFKNHRIYTLHKDQEYGDSIRVYEVNI
ncbi:MAG: 6-bladed beta-propeller [Balneolaceae bacterium]|nr:MAG: 6-bladed beta-propeller [Balneolaceae bacterium]